MATRRVELKNFSKTLEEFTHLHISEIKKGVVSGIARSVPDLVKASPVDTGLYAQSWAFTADEEKAVLGNYAPHAPIIEYGARPFTPPIAPLLQWAKRVLTNQVDKETGKKIRTGQPESGYSSEVWALAKYTQNKIAREGIKPRHILENMLPQIVENIREELRRGS